MSHVKLEGETGLGTNELTTTTRQLVQPHRRNIKNLKSKLSKSKPQNELCFELSS